jgi:hypothetical protein
MKKVYRPRFHPAFSIAGRFVLAAVQLSHPDFGGMSDDGWRYVQ